MRLKDELYYNGTACEFSKYDTELFDLLLDLDLERGRGKKLSTFLMKFDLMKLFAFPSPHSALNSSSAVAKVRSINWKSGRIKFFLCGLSEVEWGISLHAMAHIAVKLSTPMTGWLNRDRNKIAPSAVISSSVDGLVYSICAHSMREKRCICVYVHVWERVGREGERGGTKRERERKREQIHDKILKEKW